MTHEQAKARLAHFLSEPVAIIETQCAPSQLEARARWLSDLAHHVDELVHAVAVDSKQHVSAIDARELMSPLGDALIDSGIITELESEAYDLLESLREEELERA